MPETYDEASRKKDRSGSGGEYGFSVSGPGVVGTIQERIEEIRDILDFEPGEGQIEIDRPDVDPSDPTQIDLGIDLSQLDNTSLLELLTRIEFSQLIAQLDTLDAVTPPSTITVSGANQITDAGLPQAVVPSNENTEIPTRTLLILTDVQNEAPVAFGDDKVDPQTGFILRPGENMTIDLDLREEVLYMASDDDQAVVYLLGLF